MLEDDAACDAEAVVPWRDWFPELELPPGLTFEDVQRAAALVHEWDRGDEWGRVRQGGVRGGMHLGGAASLGGELRRLLLARAGGPGQTLQCPVAPRGAMVGFGG